MNTKSANKKGGRGFWGLARVFGLLAGGLALPVSLPALAHFAQLFRSRTGFGAFCATSAKAKSPAGLWCVNVLCPCVVPVCHVTRYRGSR